MLPGDPIVVETAGDWFVYRVIGEVATGDFGSDPSGIPGRQIVRPSDGREAKTSKWWCSSRSRIRVPPSHVARNS